VRLAFPLCLLLQGCFAFMVPLPRADSAGNTCVDTNAYVGQRIKNDDGRSGTLKTIYGASDRCRGQRTRPILVEVEYS
jgi:hypothetical protein